jgi:hypothetical protein
VIAPALPASLDAERSILGAVLLDNLAYTQAAEALRPDDFSLDSHRRIYSRMVELAESGRPIDLITLTEELGRHKEVEAVGGVAYITSLTDGVPRRPNIEHYVRIVKDKAMLRALARLGGRLAAEAAAPGADPDNVARWIEREASTVRRTASFTVAAGATDGGAHLEAVANFLRQFVVLSSEQAAVIALWVAHSHAIEAAEVTPYLFVSSAEKRSGKTRLLEALELVVRRPWFTGRTTAAALVRKLEADAPTLLHDESDAAFGGDEDFAEILRGTLNSGHRRGGTVSCCVGQGAQLAVRDFSVFGAKAIAGLGRLPDTVADRAFRIHLKRKTPGEVVRRFRRREVEGHAKVIRDGLASWAAGNIEALRGARPELPEALSDRAQDGAEPLLAIADLAGGEWPVRARRALCELLAAPVAQDESARVRLLSDIRAALEQAPDGRMLSADLVAALCEVEGAPWSEWNKGRPITPNTLARLLKPFEVFPRTIRAEAGRAKGYSLELFEDVFARYTGPQERDNVTSAIESGLEPLLNRDIGTAVTDAKNAPGPHKHWGVTPVTVENGDMPPEDIGAANAAWREEML